MSKVLFGIVTDNVDPDKLGRVQVRLHDYSGDVTLPWLRVMQPFASMELGVQILPEIDDHVIMIQGPGGMDGLIVIGSLFTGKRKPPPFTGGEAGDPLLRGILTPAGNEVIIDDTSGAERIHVQTKDAKVSLTMDGKELMITAIAEKGVNITSEGGPINVDGTEINLGATDITLKADSGAKIVLDGGTIEVKGGSKVAISAGAVEIG